MKKVLLMATLALGGFLVAHADYLYWSVSADANDSSPNMSTLYAYYGNTYYALSTVEGLTGSYNTTTWDGTAINWDDASYYVELANYENSTYTATSNRGPLTWAQTSSSTSLTALTSIAAAWGSAQSRAGAVPEPTSGLLMLMGFALLGLKRKKEV